MQIQKARIFIPHSTQALAFFRLKKFKYPNPPATASPQQVPRREQIAMCIGISKALFFDPGIAKKCQMTGPDPQPDNEFEIQSQSV